MAWLKVFIVSCYVLILPPKVLAEIGTVIGVQQGAELTRSGKSQPLRKGMGVASGDSISTDGKGIVQLVFVDETKIAIGPNARMVLDVTMLRGNRKAKSFAVQALGGSFRFISGKSKKRAYSIKTPTATMAVRGTTFDMWVVSGTQSAMLVLEGKVEMCSLTGSCRSTGRQCNLFATTQGGGVGRPADQEQYEKALKAGFPFVQSQEKLLAPLQVDFGGCAAESLPLLPVKSDAPERQGERSQRSEVNSAAQSGPSETESDDSGSVESSSVGSGNGGSIGGGTPSGNGNGGNINSDGNSGNGQGGSIGGGGGGIVGESNGNGGTIGGGGGTSGDGVGSGSPGGNGGNSG
ncbi:FecR family protein [Ruegeria halocynthiae]|uniref:FecR family protein n=1 Tax=Ruegeria halocynthiae TaxID=985054 RepID=UPI000AD36835|nr:FecR domain-containing protein [Ruegeria halocynthiae]